MSVIGIDIGTSYCVLATIQRGAVTIIRNELSERLTPALVAFTERERVIGDGALSQIKSNYKNTCRNIKQLLGVTESAVADVERERKFALAPIDFTNESEGCLAGYRVAYRGEEKIFTATRCMAGLLTKLRELAQKALGGPVKEVVISVPAWFSDRARQAILDAAAIADLTCLRVLNEHAAVALDYGIYRSNTFDAEKATRVAFVGVGHGSTNVSVVDFTRGQLKVLAVSSDKTFAGRDIDWVIINHFASQFQSKFGIDPLQHPKALLKLEEAASKAKVILSANLEAPFNVECLVEEYDISGILSRSELERLCLPYREQFLEQLGSTFLKNGRAGVRLHSFAGLNKEDVQHIELVGGCIRTPWIQETIAEFFEHRLPLSKTLNMDESVARGCALQAAMLDPRYRVREYNVIDSVFEPVSVAYHTVNAETEALELKSTTLFEKGCALGMKRWLTFNKNSNFELRLIAGPTAYPLVSQIELPAEALKIDLPKRIKVAAKLTPNGTVEWDTAQLLIDEEVEEAVKEKRPVATAEAESAEAPTTDGTTKTPEQELEEVEVMKKKIKTKRFECKIRSHARLGYLESPKRQSLKEQEEVMRAADSAERQRREVMNDLETYIYNLRDKISEEYREFLTPEEGAQALQSFDAAENWLYDNPEETKQVYETKLEELRLLCSPAENRHVEATHRAQKVEEFLEAISFLRSQENSPDTAHVDGAKMRSLMQKVAAAEKWLSSATSTLQASPKYLNPAVSVAQIEEEKNMLVNFSKTVLTPKPQDTAAMEDVPVQDAPNEETTGGDVPMTPDSPVV